MRRVLVALFLLGCDGADRPLGVSAAVGCSADMRVVAAPDMLRACHGGAAFVGECDDSGWCRVGMCVGDRGGAGRGICCVSQ